MKYPQFFVMLDLSRDHFGTHSEVAVAYGPGSESRESRMIYQSLLAGQYKIEGGYPCWPECGRRHPPLAVARAEARLGGVEMVWQA